MLEDSTIDRLILTINFELNKLESLMDNVIVEEKFKYLMIGKINGMIEMLRLFR
jgi:hypothetical protein